MGLLLLAAALSLAVFNVWTSWQAGESADKALSQLKPTIEQSLSKNSSGKTSGEASIPDYLLNPEMAMPEEEIDGVGYIGVLAIPTRGLELPIISEWSYANLNISPCRYSGSAYLNNLVIAGHNFTRHFGPIGSLSIGDEVVFTDVSGNTFSYKVADIETLSPYAVEEMTSEDWDLTLFTCTLGGQSRITVRCELAKS